MVSPPLAANERRKRLQAENSSLQAVAEVVAFEKPGSLLWKNLEGGKSNAN